MPDQTPASIVQKSLLTVLDEIMSQVNGYVLDRGMSMFETLAQISNEEASRPVSSQGASLAAQVNHVRFYMDAVLQHAEHADWEDSWKVSAVTDAEWRELIARLRATTEQVREFMTTFEDWNERYLGGAIGLIAHSAYHLGEIRQGLGVIGDKQ